MAKEYVVIQTEEYSRELPGRCQEWIPGQGRICAGQNSHPRKLQRFLLSVYVCVPYDFTLRNCGAVLTSRGLVPLNDLPEVEEAPRSDCRC